MLKFLLIRPGLTDFDVQRRIKGTLEIPLNGQGEDQVALTIRELRTQPLDAVYCSPEAAARQTAQAIADNRGLPWKTLSDLENLDHGLWEGKLIDEVRKFQPRIYKQWLEHPETVCPPEGEMLDDALVRARHAISTLIERHGSGTIALIVSEPIMSLVRHQLAQCELGNLWEAECACGGWELIQVSRPPLQGVEVRG